MRVNQESHFELINILDRSTKIATMGALLYWYRDDEHVLSMYSVEAEVSNLKQEKLR